MNLQVGLITIKGRVFKRFKAQLVGGVRSVGNQFAHENLLVAVQGMNHQLQQLFDFGLETEGLLGRFRCGSLGCGAGGVTHAKLPNFLLFLMDWMDYVKQIN